MRFILSLTLLSNVLIGACSARVSSEPSNADQFLELYDITIQAYTSHDVALAQAMLIKFREFAVSVEDIGIKGVKREDVIANTDLRLFRIYQHTSNTLAATSHLERALRYLENEGTVRPNLDREEKMKEIQILLQELDRGLELGWLRSS